MMSGNDRAPLLVEQFQESWARNNTKHAVDEPFPTGVVSIADQVIHFMLPENRKYQGALGNAKGMIDAVKDYTANTTVRSAAKFHDNIKIIFDFLLKVRLTSQVPLNTVHFINRKLDILDDGTGDVDKMKDALLRECDFHMDNYKVARKKIATHMSTRIIDRCEEYNQDNIIIGTHCHSGAVVQALTLSKDYIKQVIVSKTEPEQQGVLTAKKLCDAGINVRFITLEQYGMEFRRVNMFCFGVDAVSIEGTVLNKAGTRLIATLAQTKDLPVYFLGETYKYARNTLYGGLIRVEQRDVREQLLRNHIGIDLHPFYESGVLETNFSAFDTTKPEYYDSIVSEMGFLPMREAFDLAWKDYA